MSVTTLAEPGKGWPHLDLRYCFMRLPNSCLSSLVISPGFKPTDTVASAAAPWGPAPAPTPELNPFLTCLCLSDMVEAFPGSGASPGMMLPNRRTCRCLPAVSAVCLARPEQAVSLHTGFDVTTRVHYRVLTACCLLHPDDLVGFVFLKSARNTPK